MRLTSRFGQHGAANAGSEELRKATLGIASSQKVLTIRFNPETHARSLDALQWGLIPYWTKDPKIAYRTINLSRLFRPTPCPFSFDKAWRYSVDAYLWRKSSGGTLVRLIIPALLAL